MGPVKTTSGSGHLKEWLSTREVAKRLSWNVKTIRRRCLAGDIPHQRIGDGPIRVRRAWVDEMEERAKKNRAA